MIPPVASEPDPSSPVPWPSSRGRGQETGAVQEEGGLTVPGTRKARSKSPPGRRQLSTWDLITLSVSMAGAQIAWTVELGYGTPFLLELGLPAQLTSLVWLAGPISGLVAQPVIGEFHEELSLIPSTSKYRRRFWIFLSSAALVIATLILAYCQPLAGFLVDFFRVGQGDWDEHRKRQANNTAIGLAIFCFYVLDFALNGLQASLRNLLLDVTPANQLNAGNAWHGRMTNAGNIIGYGFGYLPLAELPIIRNLGGGQFRKFCIICIFILLVTVGMTCYCHEEQERPVSARQRTKKGFIDVLNDIYHTLVNLPHAIRRVCLVQLFAFMGWFPFLFYATTYVGQVMAKEIGKEPDAEFATRMGERAMLFYSIVGVVAGTVLPHLATRDRRILARYENETQDEELNYLKKLVREWRVDAAQRGRPLRLPMMPFLLRNIWTGAMLLFSLLSFSTFFISTVSQATIYITLVGICWAVAMWVPFAIIMELLKDTAPPPTPFLTERRPSHTRNLSTPANPRRMSRRAMDERRPLLRRRSHDELDSALDTDNNTTALAGGTVLGIHNLAIVMPQFIVAIVTSAIFRAVDGTPPIEGPGHEGSTYFGHNGVAWVLRFGGFCTLLGALIARMVPPTPTEKAMRRRLGEMKVLNEGPANP
ncbi:MFS general substrate transporter [Coprinellus micaceus]|uniref:MFS general substrate transporter n=1 Tax=Coprinellus micaceus TaxID=71717 RepID=A0A4Y7TN62_COPMI|nr:MFS general substrate transporter [Coprinellus micaceus]